MNINAMTHNLIAMNTQRSLGINTQNKAKSVEKLSSGYRINRGADDAAGLAISEKMRKMIRGLNQGTENAQDGISWVQIGDGSLDETHSLLHRMTELTVKSLNGTWADSDRAAMQNEFKQLQTEINRVSDQSKFNDKHIFAKHQSPAYQFQGNIEWLPNQKHLITDEMNDLTITFSPSEYSPPQTATIRVPPGQYTTLELIDEIDTAIENAGLREKGLLFEYTANGTCNLNLEGGLCINEAVGGLSYLLYDVYKGGSTGALIGTTQFLSDTAKLPIRAGLNDNLEFDIESLGGQSIHKNLTVPAGNYTRDELIEWLNTNLQDTSAVAIKYGQGIKLTSDDSIITGLKGNMFKVDNPEKGEVISTSIFYDNIGYGPVTMIPASLTGGGVLTTDITDVEHGYFHIEPSNNQLTVRPNGSSAATTLVIPDGYYTAESMKDKLNELFANQNIELQADIYTDKDKYQGLIITSTVKGLESDVGIDKTSSAYNTLFVTRAYNKLQESEKYVRDKIYDSNAYFIGGKSFYNDSWPMTVEPGVNDTFQLSVNGVLHEISLAKGDYNNMTDFVTAINKAITDAKATAMLKYPNNPEIPELLGSVQATAYGSNVRLISSHKDVTTVMPSAYTDKNNKVNDGFANIFTTHITYTSTSSQYYSPGVVTTNTPINLPATITDNKKLLSVYVDNKPYSVTIPPGKYNDYNSLLDVINKQLPTASYQSVPITFSNVNTYGVNNTFTNTSTGQTVPPSQPIQYLGAGKSDLNQGQVGDNSKDTAAEVKLDIPYFPSSGGLTLTNSNNAIDFEINGLKKTIYLDANKKFNSMTDLKNNLQSKLNDWLGTGDNGVQVTVSGSKLVLTTNQKGDGALIKCGTDTSNFLYSMNTKITTASIQLSKPLQSSMAIKTGDNDTFKFKYNGSDVNITLPAGNYNRDQLRTEINNQLIAKGIDVRVEMNGSSFLTLKATTPGAGHKLEFDSTNGGTCITSVFQNADSKLQPATATLDADIQDPITIDSSSDKFTIIINHTAHTVTLDAGTYNRSNFASHLNTKLQGAGVSVTLDGNKLKFTTTAIGTSAHIQMTHAGGGSSMKAIFGEKQQLFRGVEASFSPDHKLLLTALDQNGNPDSNGQVAVYSSNGSIFQLPKQSPPQTHNGTANTGYHSKIYSCIDGASLKNTPIKITQWNNNLSFNYYYNGYSRNVSITLDQKEYTYEELEKALQEKLDASTGTGNSRLTVKVDSNGVNILAGSPGRDFYFDETSFRGGFYYNILRHTPEQKYDTTAYIRKGGSDGDVYAVGRKDIRNTITEITQGVNDTLRFDFTYDGTVERLTMTLDPGKYSGASLITHLQEKLNEQLVKKGFEPNTILASIGGVNTGVTGNNDNNALVFKLNNYVKLPKVDVEYKIDGIGGSAAFSVFYQTDGDIKVAYITGTKDISNGVTIPKNSNFSFDTDGKHYSITVPAGKYTADGIIKELNKQFKAANAPILAKLEGKNLKLTHTKYGEHHITNISGDAKRYLFFQENSFFDEEQKINIMPSDNSNDKIVIDKPAVNTATLGIHSVIITNPKYAKKALTRIGEAVSSVSEIRGMFGAVQNRLEHTIDSNNNTAENLQASESIIRDTDMSREALEMSRSNILENVGQIVLTQANQAKRDVLRLLE